MASECGTCDNGWVHVDEHYLDRTFPWPIPRSQDQADIAVWKDACTAVEARRRDAKNTVFPCRICNPVAFDTWRVKIGKDPGTKEAF